MAATYNREKEMADDPSFPDMAHQMPKDNMAIDEERIRLLRNGPDTRFRTFRRAAIPDVDVPGNLLHVRPADSQVP